MITDRRDVVSSEFDRITQRLLGSPGGAGSAGAALPMDVVREQDGLVVRVDVPGVPAAELGVTLEDGVLTVTAERRHSYGEPDRVLLQERFDGVLRRRLRLPDWVDAARAEAAHADGVLTVRLPMAERARPRTLAVQTTSSEAAAAQIDAA